MSLQFSTHLLDGFDQLAKRTEEVMKSTIEIQSWFKKLHSILDIYAKGLVKISNSSKKKKVGGVSSIEVGTLKDGWQSIHTEIENIGNKHQTCAQTLNNDIIVRMTNFINEKTQARKKFVTDSAKINTEMKTALALLQKAKANYYARFKESEAAKLALNKAKADSNVKPKKINELTTKVTKATDVVSQADKEYQSVLRKTNEKQAKYYETEMPALLEVFQKFEEDRLSFLKEIFEKFAEIVKDFPAAVQSLSDEIATAVENINVQNDIQTFIEQNATGVTPPAPINYEPCDSDVPSPSPSAQNNNAGNVTPVREKEYGVDDNLPKEEKASRIHAQLNELRETIEAEIKSQKGIEKLVTFYAKDPAGQEKAKAELEENKSKVAKLQQSYAQLESQYKDLTGITLAPIDFGGEDTRDVKIEATGPQSVKVRALYDYDATNETELSFKENDILSITEQDESGWWFAEIAGRGGFIPRNYVEIQ